MLAIIVAKPALPAWLRRCAIASLCVRIHDGHAADLLGIEAVAVVRVDRSKGAEDALRGCRVGHHAEDTHRQLYEPIPAILQARVMPSPELDEIHADSL